MTTILIVTFIAAFVVTAAGVFAFEKLVRRRGILDIPNERSSHTVPTPRGGGLVIASVVVTAYIAASLASGQPVSTPYLLGALLIVGVSWLDDAYSMPFFVRLAVHFAAAILVVASIGGVETLCVPFVDVRVTLGVFGPLLTVLWIVWLVNAYNFMDGIDGIAGLQAVVGGLAWAVAGTTLGLPVAQVLGGTVVAASLGFLLYNWQPAKIFMGDAGSAFLGFTFATLPLVASTAGLQRDAMFPLGIAFVCLFVFDSIYTFFRRLSRREAVWRAHRSHLYQRLVIAGRSHALVTVVYGISAFVVAAACLLNTLAGIAAAIAVPIVLVVAVWTAERQAVAGGGS